jgi:hypothetical protein
MSGIELECCAIDAHQWANEPHEDGHIEARCIVCLRWLGDVVAHEAATQPKAE